MSFKEKKFAQKIVKPKTKPDENSRKVEKIVIPPEKRELERIKASVIRWNTIKCLSY